MVKLIKIEKNRRTDSRIRGSRISLECVVSIVQRQKLTANDLNKPNRPKQKVWYLRWAILETAIERGCGKWCSKSNTWKISVKEFFLIAYIKNHIYVYIIHFWFFNKARESDKSYMINHVVYFGLNIGKVKIIFSVIEIDWKPIIFDFDIHI